MTARAGVGILASMPRTRVAYHEVSFEVAARLERREAHEPTLMRSGNSKGPVKMYVCDRPRCGGYAYTYTASAGTPVCHGGALFSFVTTGGIFDPNVHQPWAAR